MKTQNYIIVFFFLFAFISCEDVYHAFPDGVEDLFVYNIGDRFSLLNSETKDTLFFEITSYENEYIQELNNPLLVGHDQYHQYFSIQFNTENGYSGGMYAEGNYTSPTISINGEARTIFEGELVDTFLNYVLNEEKYSELFVFAKEKGESPMLYYTKEQGIVYIESTDSENSYSLIKYIKNQ